MDPHEPLYTLVVHDPAPVPQLWGHTRLAIGAIALRMDLTDRVEGAALVEPAPVAPAAWWRRQSLNADVDTPATSQATAIGKVSAFRAATHRCGSNVPTPSPTRPSIV